jgi:hypothetical protein
LSPDKNKKESLIQKYPHRFVQLEAATIQAGPIMFALDDHGQCWEYQSGRGWQLSPVVGSYPEPIPSPPWPGPLKNENEQ